MLIDSHCHLNFPELRNNLDDVIMQMKHNKISHALCIGTRLDNLAQVVTIADSYPNIFASVGIHPDEENQINFSCDTLLQYTDNTKVIGIGETGLDYYRLDNNDSTTPAKVLEQQSRFITHIEVAKEVDLPLIIHTRNAFADTLGIMQEHNAAECGAVMHCFTESVAEARQVLDSGFYISISGIVTFKNATQVQEMAKFVPSDRLLVETDAPFLAPMPYRGKTNQPAYVRHTAEYLAILRKEHLEDLAYNTSCNFATLFKKSGLIF